jgi:hypothetical protein
MKLSQKLRLEHDSGDCGGYLEGFAEMAEALENAKPKIKMAKALPADVGQYYWAHFSGDIPQLVEAVWPEFITDPSEPVPVFVGVISVESMGGYWAKVEQSMFEFEGE